MIYSNSKLYKNTNELEEYKNMNKKRVEWLDIARGIGIILVVLGHAVSGSVRSISKSSDIIYNIIYFFHMPLLVFLSGCSYKISQEQYMKKGYLVLKDKIKQLLLPYISYSFFIFLCFRIAYLIPVASKILTKSSYNKITINQWFKLMLMGYNKYSIHLWYIYALFLMFGLTFVVQNTFKNYKTILLVASLVLYFLSLNYSNITLVISILHYCSLYYIMFVLGAFYIKETVMKANWIKIVAVIGILYAILESNSDIDMNNILGKNIKIIIDLGAKMVLIFLICNFAMMINGRLKKLLKYIGKESFGIYIFHQPFYCSGVGMVLCAVGGIPVSVIISIAIVLSFFVPYCIVKILNLNLMISKVLSFLFLGKMHREN